MGQVVKAGTTLWWYLCDAWVMNLKQFSIIVLVLIYPSQLKPQGKSKQDVNGLFALFILTLF